MEKLKITFKNGFMFKYGAFLIKQIDENIDKMRFESNLRICETKDYILFCETNGKYRDIENLVVNTVLKKDCKHEFKQFGMLAKIICECKDIRYSNKVYNFNDGKAFFVDNNKIKIKEMMDIKEICSFLTEQVIKNERKDYEVIANEATKMLNEIQMTKKQIK